MFPDIQFDYKLMGGEKRIFIQKCTGAFMSMSVPASILYLNANYVGSTADIDAALNRTDPIA